MVERKWLDLAQRQLFWQALGIGAALLSAGAALALAAVGVAVFILNLTGHLR